MTDSRAVLDAHEELQELNFRRASAADGSHYELLGLWKGQEPPEWRCHLCKYVGRDD